MAFPNVSKHSFLPLDGCKFFRVLVHLFYSFSIFFFFECVCAIVSVLIIFFGVNLEVISSLQTEGCSSILFPLQAHTCTCTQKSKGNPLRPLTHAPPPPPAGERRRDGGEGEERERSSSHYARMHMCAVE